MSDFKIGIDYGGTKIEGILIDSNGKEILRKRSTYEKKLRKWFKYRKIFSFRI